MIKRRSSFVTVIDNSWKSSLYITIILLIEVITEGVKFSRTFGIIGLLVFLGLLTVFFLFQVIRWRITYFVYDGETVTLLKNGIFKKRLTIPLDKISTVDIKKNILGHITGTSRVKIDSGSKNMANKEEGAEINLIFDDKFAEEIRCLILKEERKTFQETTFTMTPKDFLLDGLLQRKLIYAIPILGTVFFFIGNFLGDRISEKLVDEAFSLLNLGALVVTLIVIGFIVLANITSIISEIIRYHNFTLYKQKDVLVTNFGLFTTESFTLPINKIRSITLTQNTLFRLFGYYTISVVCIGFGDEKKERSVIFPIANREKVDKILSLIDPAIIENRTIHKVPKKGRLFYILPPVIYAIILSILSAIIITLTKVNPLFSIAPLLIALILFLVAILTLRNTSLSYDGKYVVVTRGSFTKVSIILPTSHVQSVSKREPFFKKKRNLCNLKIDYYSGIQNPLLTSFETEQYTSLANILEKD